MIGYRFGSFELQPDQCRLLVDGHPAALGPRAFDLLLALVERAGQLVSKNQLLDLVWPGLVVEENNLQVQISTLRKVLGPQAIATIPGRGYRWTLAADDASAQAARSESAPPAMSVESAAPADVPSELPALYGRFEDVAALRDLIRHHALVAVVGPAGLASRAWRKQSRTSCGTSSRTGCGWWSWRHSTTPIWSETTRTFALERLAARAATLPMLHRHAEVMLRLFERFYRDNLGGTPVGEQVKRLGADLDNLRGAMRWASGSEGDRRIAIALIGASGAGRGFLWNAGLPWEGWQWCKALRPLVDASIPATEAARFWLACAEQGIAGSLDMSIQDAQQAIRLYRHAQDRLGEFLGCQQLAYALAIAGPLEDARLAIGEAEVLLDASWPLRLRAIHENIAGLYFDCAGKPHEARDHLVAYLNLSRQMRSDSDELTALILLADLDVACGHADRAVENLREPISRFRALTTKYDDGIVFRNYATALMEAGELQEADSAFREALPLIRRAYGSAAFVLHDAALLLARRGQIDDAARMSAYAESVYAGMGRKPRRVAQHNQDQLRALLSARRSAEALVQLSNEGRALTDDQACSLAFPPLAADARESNVPARRR